MCYSLFRQKTHTRDSTSLRGLYPLLTEYLKNVLRAVNLMTCNLQSFEFV